MINSLTLAELGKQLPLQQQQQTKSVALTFCGNCIRSSLNSNGKHMRKTTLDEIKNRTTTTITKTIKTTGA